MPKGKSSGGGPRTHSVKNPGWTGAVNRMMYLQKYINCTDRGHGVVSGPSLTPLDKLGSFKGNVYYVKRDDFKI